MKKLVFGLIATILLTSYSFGQSKISFLDIKNKEIAIIIDNNNNTFKEYYLFQYDNQDFDFFLNKELIGNIEIVNNNLIIITDKIKYLFAINDENKDEKIIFKGYGLSQRKGDFRILENLNQPNIYHIIINRLLGGSELEGNGQTGIRCLSGGVGTSSCEVTPSTANIGAASCKVTCSTGYYSCCDDSVGECRCVANPK